MKKIDELYKSLEVLSFFVEKLEKSKDSDLKQLKGDPKAQEVVDFAHNNLRDKDQDGQLGHENWSNFYVNQYKKDPSIHNQENQESLKHFMGMKHLPQVKEFKFHPEKHPDFQSGMNALKEAESTGLKAAHDEEKRWTPNSGSKQIDLGNGWGWWNLGVPYSEAEGKACTHCGNVEGKEGEGLKDQLWSLRQEDPSRPGMAKPHVTVVNNKGYLGEMKGFKNSKPGQKFHNAINQLLLSKHVKGVVGSGYAPEANFQGADLNPKQYKEITDKKPRIFSPDISELPKKFAEKDNLNPEVTDLDTHSYHDPEANRIIQGQHNKKYSSPEKIANGLKSIKDERKLEKFIERAISNPKLSKDNLAEILNISKGTGFLGDDKSALKNHPLLLNPETAKDVYGRVGNGNLQKMLSYAPNLTQERFDEVFDHNPASVAKYHHNHPMLGHKHFEELANQGKDRWLNNPNMSKNNFDSAYKHHQSEVAYWGAESPHFDKKQILETIPKVDYWGNHGINHFYEDLKKNPNVDKEVLESIHQHNPIQAAHYFSDSHDYNQKMVDDLSRSGDAKSAIYVTNKRPDLKMPKEAFDSYINFLDKDKWHGNALDALSDLSRESIYNHPHFNSEHIDQLSYLDKKLGDHPKATDEQKYNIKQKPIDDFINNFHSLDGNEKTKQFDRLHHRMTDEQKSALINHPDTSDSFKATYGGRLLSEWNLARLLVYHGHGPRGVKVTPSVIDKALSLVKGDPQAHRMLLSNVSDLKISSHHVDMTPEQAKVFVDNGISPISHAIAPFLSDEQKIELSKNMDKHEKYRLWIRHSKDRKELPIKAFKPYYRDVTDDSPHEDVDLARTAMEDEAEARHHQLLTRTLGPNGKDEDLHKYKNSHDHEVATAARNELKRRGLLQKSNSLFLLMKKAKSL